MNSLHFVVAVNYVLIPFSISPFSILSAVSLSPKCHCAAERLRSGDQVEASAQR